MSQLQELSDAGTKGTFRLQKLPGAGPEGIVVFGAIPREVVVQQLEGLRDEARACHGSTDGFEVKFVVMSAGQSTSGRVSPPAAKAEECIMPLLKSLKLPRPKGGGLTIVTWQVR
ncbi:MAG: hypothetical protein ACOZIN_12340 [Myxococcota bacterium]